MSKKKDADIELVENNKVYSTSTELKSSIFDKFLNVLSETKGTFKNLIGKIKDSITPARGKESKMTRGQLLMHWLKRPEQIKEVIEENQRVNKVRNKSMFDEYYQDNLRDSISSDRDSSSSMRDVLKIQSEVNPKAYGNAGNGSPGKNLKQGNPR